MRSLTGSNLSLATLPDAAVKNIYIPAFGNQLQDANYIYVPDIQRMVNAGFYGSAAVKPAKSVTVDVYNGSGAPNLAGEAAQAFASQGYTAGKADNASAQSQPVQDDTQVFYGAGAAADAESIADEVGAMTASGALGATALPSLPAGHVEVLLGSTVTALPAGLETYGGTHGHRPGLHHRRPAGPPARQRAAPGLGHGLGRHPVRELRARRRAPPGASPPGDEADRQAVGRQHLTGQR